MKRYRLPIIFALIVLVCVLELVERSSIKPRIVQPFEFEELTVSSFDEVTDVDSLFDQKISMGGQDGYEFLRMDLEDNKSYVRVETAGQYLEMRRKGAAPYTTYDITMDSWFKRIVPPLVFSRHSSASKRSLLGDDLMDLSVSILPWVGSEERIQLESDTAKGVSLEDYSKTGQITSVKKSENRISFETSGMRHSIDELVRGDYDGDGYEDSIIQHNEHYIEGTGRSSTCYIVKRTDESKACTVEHFDYLTAQKEPLAK
ncbi:MAG: hypothetical protein P8L44_21230 [Opitutales bacterium]|nr:hypothetical protein [Opitutales bacterium]